MGGLLGHRGLLLAGSVAGGVTDPDFASVTCLLHFEGADASTTFTDVKGTSWTVRGDAQIDTARSKYGTASGLFDGAGDMLSGPNSNIFDFPANFTVEAWIYLASITGAYQVIFNRFSQGAGAGNGGLGFYVNPSGKLECSRAGVTTIGTGATTLSTGTWHHVAVTREGGAGAMKMWLNGVQDFSGTSAASLTESLSGTPGIGGLWNATSSTVSQAFNGSIDEFRITKGLARYTSAFTPPTAAFPDS